MVRRTRAFELLSYKRLTMHIKYAKGVLLIVVVGLTACVHMELQSDFRDFVDLAPRKRIGYIAARHLILDEKFRISLKYLHSSRFVKTWNRIRNSKEFHELVEFLRTHDVSVESLQDVSAFIDKLPNQLRALRIPAKVPVTMMIQRNLASFMSEVMQALPRARFSGLMARKVTEGGDFARLYKAVQQKEFHQLLERAQSSPALTAIWSEWRRQYIDVHHLVEIMYEVISWGP